MGDIAAHGAAEQAYAAGGLKLRALADRAVEWFERQPATEKRKLMDYVVSGARWKGGELVPEYRKPFDMVVGSISDCLIGERSG